MSDDEGIRLFATGLIGGFVLTACIMFIFNNETQTGLDKCAKQHNVYVCEYVAVPNINETKGK